MIKSSLILIGGPTASGKSALAMDIARRENGRIINADAMQVYSGLPILTSQPEQKDKKQITHELYEVADPSVRSSAGVWLALAQKAIRDTVAHEQTPIVVGGTGLYFKALLEGLADIPPIPDDVRALAQNLYAEKGADSFRMELHKIDPESVARYKPNDKQRLIRAYEVVRYTGKPIGHWQSSSCAKPNPAHLDPKRYELRPILLMPPRDKLYEACNHRFLDMMQRGASKEVQALLDRHLDPDLPVMKVLGVRELASHLNGDLSRDDAIAKAQQATRNYAKRQMTWFRNQWKDMEGLTVY